jgi:uncharacterized membrane protein
MATQVCAPRVLSAAARCTPFLAAVFVGSGAAHFLVPGYFESLVPGFVPYARLVVRATGVADLAIGASLAARPTRRAGGRAATALLVAYLVPHVDAAFRADANGPVLTRPPVVALRLAVNAAYLLTAVGAAAEPSTTSRRRTG